MNKILLITLLLAHFASIKAQDSDSPKLAVVLSGGGAKGMAHIPLLKALDSLGVIPDLIVGNSMGSIVGGFYAIGYSADSIEQIAKNLDWDKLFATKVAYNHINNTERDEYEKYLAEVPFDGLKPSLPMGLINGQELGLLLSIITLPVLKVDDFDQLPIPFRCVATDIGNGKEVIFSSGDLSLAMRASMSIPSVFTPVHYKETLLVDGGILNNFPVNIAREWGADIIIGSDVSGGLKSEEELSSMPDLVFQSAMISSNLRNSQQQENCDILLNHLPNLTHGNGDFRQTSAIIKEGEVALKDKMDELVSLLSPYRKSETPNRLPEVDEIIVVDEIRILKASEGTKRLLTEKFGLNDKTFTIDQLEEKIRLASGSRNFETITYYIEQENDQKILSLEVTERLNTFLKGAIHYDTEQGAGIIFNATVRDLLGRNSRSLLSIDAAENPKFRLQQQGYLTKNQEWWYRTEYYLERLRLRAYSRGLNSEDLIFNHQKLFLQVNRDLSNNAWIGLEGEVNQDAYVPTIEAETRGISRNDTTRYIEKVKHPGAAIGLNLNHNTFNKRYYPTSGTSLIFNSSYYFYQEAEINLFTNHEAYYKQMGENLSPRFNDMLQSYVNFRSNIPLGKNWVLQPHIQAFASIINDPDFTESGLLKYFFVGGIDERPRNQFVTFSGLREGELQKSQGALWSVDLQWTIRPNLHLIPTLGAGILSDRRFRDFFSDLERLNSRWYNSGNSSYIYSFGTQLAYMTPLGPIQLGVAKVSEIDNIRAYFSIGFHFY